MQYHPGPNMSKIRDYGGLPSLIFTVFIVCAVGSVVNPIGYVVTLVLIEISALAIIPLVRKHREKDSRDEALLFGGHYLSQGDVQQAGLLEDAKDYTAAAKAWSAITASDPSNGFAWYRLGSSLLATKQFDAAVAAETKATEFPDVRERALYNIACARAQQGRSDEALDALERAVDSGFNYRWMLDEDADLASIRQSPRFQEILSRADVAPRMKESHDPSAAPPSALRSGSAGGSVAGRQGEPLEPSQRPAPQHRILRVRRLNGASMITDPRFMFSSMPGRSWLNHVPFIVLLLLLLAGLVGLFLSQLPPGYL